MGLNRRILREHIFKLLFLLDFQPDADEEERGRQIGEYFSQVPDEEIEHPPIFADDEDRRYISEKVAAITDRIPEIDGRLNQAARGWRTGRMAKADLAILRLGTYEILYDDQIPAGVAINEAVELAKIFGSSASPSFINGVLGTLVPGEGH